MSKLASRRYQDLPVGYRPVRVDWKDLDKCSVCHMDEVKANFSFASFIIDNVLYNICLLTLFFAVLVYLYIIKQD
jgi:hypothetical protein